jgi:hypothetical protein
MQAGQPIRQEDLARTFERLLGRSPVASEAVNKVVMVAAQHRSQPTPVTIHAEIREVLRPGEPPDGQRYLRQAFRRYYQAHFEADVRTKAELLLLANLEIGFHAQTRLQPEIAESLNAPIVDPAVGQAADSASIRRSSGS